MASYIHVPDEAPAVPKIDVTVDENDYRPGALKLMKELRPSWRPFEIKMKVRFISLHALSFHVKYLLIFTIAFNSPTYQVFITLPFKKREISY